MNEAKVALRRKLKQARLELGGGEHRTKSQAIVKKLEEATDWSRIKTLHYFEPIHELFEVDTTDFISYLEDTYPSLKLFTPRKIEGQWELVAAKGGQPPKEIDLVIVPMLGFDKRLQRIGYGGGYYDKFLSTQPTAIKIGVCFELGKVDLLPGEAHDIPLDKIITEDSVYE